MLKTVDTSYVQNYILMVGQVKSGCNVMIVRAGPMRSVLSWQVMGHLFVRIAKTEKPIIAHKCAYICR